MRSIKTFQSWVRRDWEVRSGGLPNSEAAMLFVIEELGEVAECIRVARQGKSHRTSNGSLESEFGDLLLSLTTLACVLEIDLVHAAEDVRRKIDARAG